MSKYNQRFLEIYVGSFLQPSPYCAYAETSYDKSVKFPLKAVVFDRKIGLYLKVKKTICFGMFFYWIFLAARENSMSQYTQRDLMEIYIQHFL